MIIILLALAGLGLAICRFEIMTNPARRPVWVIEAEAISIAPIGSSILEVQTAIKKHYAVDTQPHYWGIENKHSYLPVHIGQYFEWRYFPLYPTTVSVNWVFDENHKLQEVNVDQILEAP